MPGHRERDAARNLDGLEDSITDDKPMIEDGDTRVVVGEQVAVHPHRHDPRRYAVAGQIATSTHSVRPPTWRTDPLAQPAAARRRSRAENGHQQLHSQHPL